ncbi:response regulator [Jannaschia faecimaris]|uniref:response regulator n=1 Tax=Jannaschia faecimaris TaxID=1244108 RepID=UPI0011133A64|nr:response regulator [Jannaschia faecimaris]
MTPDSPIILIPLTLSPEDQVPLLSRIGPAAHVVLLGRREQANPDLRARAAVILPVSVAGVDLVTALQLKEPAAIALTSIPRLLVADDNATNRLLLGRMLRDQPYQVTLVSDGAEAVAAFADHPHDAVILDISMPYVDGFEAARQIRGIEAEQGLTRAPKLALTAHVGEDMASRLEAAGFAAVLTKPLRMEVLTQALTKALARA